MKRIVLAVTVVAIAAAALAAWSGAVPSATSGAGASSATEAEAATATCRHQAARTVDRRRQVRRAAVRVHQRERPECRLRRRDRPLVRSLCLRKRESRQLRLRTDTGPRASVDHGSRRSRHLDVHVYDRPRYTDRLLAGVLQGGWAPAREERRAGPVTRQPGRQDGGYDQRLRLRPLAQELLPADEGTRVRQLHERGAGAPRRQGGHGDVGRHRRPRHRHDGRVPQAHRATCSSRVRTASESSRGRRH